MIDIDIDSQSRYRSHPGTFLSAGGTRTSRGRLAKLLPLLFALALVLGCVAVTATLAKASTGCSGSLNEKAACYAREQVGRKCDWDNAKSGRSCDRIAFDAYRKAGLANTYRSPAAAYRNAAKKKWTVPLAKARPGDVIFFHSRGAGIDRVGVLVDAERVVMAVGTTYSTKTASFRSVTLTSALRRQVAKSVERPRLAPQTVTRPGPEVTAVPLSDGAGGEQECDTRDDGGTSDPGGTPDEEKNGGDASGAEESSDNGGSDQSTEGGDTESTEADESELTEDDDSSTAGGNEKGESEVGSSDDSAGDDGSGDEDTSTADSGDGGDSGGDNSGDGDGDSDSGGDGDGDSGDSGGDSGRDCAGGDDDTSARDDNTEPPVKGGSGPEPGCSDGASTTTPGAGKIVIVRPRCVDDKPGQVEPYAPDAQRAGIGLTPYGKVSTDGRKPCP